MNCVLAVLASVLSVPWDVLLPRPAFLLIRDEPKISYADIANLGKQYTLSALAALSLPRVARSSAYRCLWWWVLAQYEGVYMLSALYFNGTYHGYARAHSPPLHRFLRVSLQHTRRPARPRTQRSHALGWNAGASILYLGRQAIVVTQHDRDWPDLFAQKMVFDFNIVLRDDATVRRVCFNPQVRRACVGAHPAHPHSLFSHSHHT